MAWLSVKKSILPRECMEIPKQLQPLVAAFSASSNSEAKALIFEASQLICGGTSKEEVEGVLALIRSINPVNSIEAIFAAQAIASYLLGLRLISKGYKKDQTLGLRFLKHSSETLAKLGKR